MILNLITLQAAQGQGGGSMFIWMIILLVVMWILMMRPQRKREKEEQKFRQGLQKGDRVMFSGGIYGKVHSVGEHTVEVEVSNGVIMEVEKSMITPTADAKSTDKK